MWPSASASIFIFFVQPRHHYWEYVEGYGKKIVWILLGAGCAITFWSQLFQAHKRVQKSHVQLQAGKQL
jgi:biotin carboxylase